MKGSKREWEKENQRLNDEWTKLEQEEMKETARLVGEIIEEIDRQRIEETSPQGHTIQNKTIPLTQEDYRKYA